MTQINKIQTILLCLFAFLLPFGLLVNSILIGLLFLTSIVQLSKQDYIQLFRNKFSIGFLAFFFLTLFSACFSKNKTEAFSAVEIKLSFLLFPFIFSSLKNNVEVIRKTLQFFIYGCLLACIILVCRAFYWYLQSHPEYFFYTAFSDFIHPSYFAFYLTLAFLITLYAPAFLNSKKTNSLFKISTLIVFTICIILCSSKLGLIGFALSLLFIALVWIYRAFGYIKLIAFTLVVFLGLFLVIKFIPAPFERFKSVASINLDKIDKTSSESTSVRILIWKEALSISKNNFWLGTTVGDANDNLYKYYSLAGLSGALEHRFNAHNQFLQTQIGLGIFGTLLLFLLLAGIFIASIKQKNKFQFLFIVLVFLNFCVESMLQTSAGVIFFAFIYSIVCNYKIDFLKSE